MNQSYKEQLKKSISEILVKWSMPTRQVAINEIILAFETYLATKKSEVEKLKIVPVEIPHGSPYISGFNEGIDAALEILEK